MVCNSLHNHYKGGRRTVDRDMSEARKSVVPREAADWPTGWAVIAKNDSVVDMIDRLLSMPADREFNKSELAELADVSRKSVHTHIDLLLQLGVVTEVPDTTPTRYRFDPENEVALQLMRLESAVNAAGPYAEGDDDST